MSRLVELGRAVLDTPSMNHELWLTTLITILPEQKAAYLAQLTQVQCLEALASGVPWVHRGHGMYMDLRLALNNEALSHKPLQDLANAVLQAPIWNQLMLRPSLPSNAITAPGTIRLDISHAAINGRETEQKRHRLFSNVPASDIRPPEEILSVALQSVRLSIDILETSPCRRLTVRRSHPSSSGREVSKSETEHAALNLFDPDSTEGSPRGDPSNSTALASSRKRKRPVTGMSQHGPSSILPSQADIRAVVESALRLSIRGTINKPCNGCRIKASTFRAGLADIAPTLWRGGYLDALSDRAQLMPTIAQSLVQTGFVNATSASLKSKMESINNITRMGQQNKVHESGPTSESGFARIRSSTTAQLWMHSQRILSHNPVPPVQACIGSYLDEADSDSDDMLAEEHGDWSDRAKGGNNILSNLSETIDDGCALPSTPPMTTSNSDLGQVQHPSSRSISGNYVPEFEEELLFTFPP